MIIQELNKNFGCYIDGFDTADSSDSARVCMIKRALSKYKFVVMRGLNLEASALEKLGSKFGQFADDPYLESLDNYEHVIEVRRDARETTPIFGSDWHSDWSFQKNPRYIHSFMLKKSLLLVVKPLLLTVSLPMIG